MLSVLVYFPLKDCYGASFFTVWDSEKCMSSWAVMNILRNIGFWSQSISESTISECLLPLSAFACLELTGRRRGCNECSPLSWSGSFERLTGQAFSLVTATRKKSSLVHTALFSGLELSTAQELCAWQFDWFCICPLV